MSDTPTTDEWRHHVAREIRLMEADAMAAEIERLRAALKRIANCGQSVEPDHWKFRVMVRDVAIDALTQMEP